MVEINSKKLCESCFFETEESVCPNCGYSKEKYTADPMVLPMGTMLNDKIIIGRIMGKGGFGITYLGYDTRMEKMIAVKEYYPNGIAYRSHDGTDVLIADTKSKEAFENGSEKFYTEAKIVAQFNGNPNIVSVYDYFRENNTVYLLMEYLDGVTLKNYIKDHENIPDSQALFIMDKIAAALSITHSAGVLHRDISPDNIMLCADGKVKLIDFGAARQIMAESSSNLTVVLKPGYTPIEQYTKKGMQGAWTDIYSLGVTTYYTLTGTIIDDPYERMNGDDEFTENRHEINTGLWKIIKKCTMINASDRYGSAIELRKALSSLSQSLKPEPILLEPVEPADVKKKSSEVKTDEADAPDDKKTESDTGTEKKEAVTSEENSSGGEFDLKIEDDPGLDLSVNVYKNKKTGLAKLLENKKAVTAVCSAVAAVMIVIIGISIASSNRTDDIAVDTPNVTDTVSEQQSVTGSLTETSETELSITEADTTTDTVSADTTVSETEEETSKETEAQEETTETTASEETTATTTATTAPPTSETTAPTTTTTAPTTTTTAPPATSTTVEDRNKIVFYIDDDYVGKFETTMHFSLNELKYAVKLFGGDVKVTAEVEIYDDPEYPDDKWYGFAPVYDNWANAVALKNVNGMDLTPDNPNYYVFNDITYEMIGTTKEVSFILPQSTIDEMAKTAGCNGMMVQVHNVIIRKVTFESA